jgi:hypothetical protein
MFIEKLASFAQEPQRAFTGAEIFLPGVGKGKPSLTPAHKQQIQMFFESGQGPAYRGSRELEMGRRSAERSRLRGGDEYSDAIEIGRFAHVQAGCAVVIILCSASLEDVAVPSLLADAAIQLAQESRPGGPAVQP